MKHEIKYYAAVSLLALAALSGTYTLGQSNYRDFVLIQCAQKDGFTAPAGPLKVQVQCTVMRVGA